MQLRRVFEQLVILTSCFPLQFGSGSPAGEMNMNKQNGSNEVKGGKQEQSIVLNCLMGWSEAKVIVER